MNASVTSTRTSSCPQRDRVIRLLTRDSKWSCDTPKIPYSLGMHLAQCPLCRKVANDLTAVNEILSDCRSQRQERTLLGQANVHALRILQRVVRASEEAKKLSCQQNESKVLYLLRGPIQRIALTSSAALILVCLRAGWLDSWSQGRELAEKLAQVHLERHVIHDPQEWT